MPYEAGPLVQAILQTTPCAYAGERNPDNAADIQAQRSLEYTGTIGCNKDLCAHALGSNCLACDYTGTCKNSEIENEMAMASASGDPVPVPTPTVLDVNSLTDYHHLVKMILTDRDATDATLGDPVFEDNFSSLETRLSGEVPADPAMSCMDTDDMSFIFFDGTSGGYGPLLDDEGDGCAAYT